MAELDLCLTEKDELPIIVAALEMGYEVIPDLLYSSDQYEALRTSEGFSYYRPRTRLFYLCSESIRCPVEMRKIEKEGKTLYYVQPLPLISFMGGGIFERHGSKFIRRGFIGYSSRFSKPTPELIDAYKNMAKIAKSAAPTRVKLGKKVFWLGIDSRQAVEDGAKLVGYETCCAQDIVGAPSTRKTVPTK